MNPDKQSIEDKRFQVESLRAELAALKSDIARIERRSETDKKEMWFEGKKAARSIPVYIAAPALFLLGAIIGTIFFLIAE